MKLTNKLNLPQPIVDAVKNDGYTKSGADISVTELLLPPMLRALQVKHAEETEEDVSDRIFSLLGQTVHGILERSESEGVAERRLSITVSGWVISGGMDRFVAKDGLLQDYKLTTVYKTLGGKLPEEWVKQLNVYAEILRQNGEEVKKLEIVAIYRDWSKGNARREADYPKRQVEVVSVPLIPSEEVSAFIKQRVEEHQAAQTGDFKPCTAEERWARPDVWALMQDGKERAKKLYYKEGDAPTALKADEYVQHRPGTSIRCEDYCSVKKFCSYYNTQIKKEKK